MKKALSLILLISLVITILVGCGGGSNNQNDPGNQDNVGNQNGGQTDDIGDKPSSDSSDKQVPVYQGMSISHTKVSANHTVIPGVFKNDKDNGNGNNNGNNGNHYGQYKGDSTDEDTEPDDENPFPDNNEDENIEEEVKSSLEVIGSKEEIYYASANQNIYINIHIFNPDSFEILSFTLNGKKYSSYMFEDGSDMETIILKYNVGDVSGIVDYTIDAIKYIDGTEIKDVIIDGDKTVKAGVYKDNQVTANVGNVNINTSSISFNVDVSDNDNLLEFSKGKLHAVIYDGNQILKEIEISKGENAVFFDGLQSNKVYQYAIIGHYDNLNGNGFGMNVLYKDAFVTEAVVLFDNIVIGQEYISFGFAWHKDYQGSNITSLNLYQDETAMKEQSADSCYIDGLLSGSTYYLVAEYDHDGKTESIHLEFTTFAKGIPGITLSISEATKSSIKFNINEVDDEEIGEVTKIELVHKNGTVIAENVDIREFTNLLSNNYYTLRVTYSYDLNDGNGIQDIVREISARTYAKAIPTGAIENVVSTKDSISFEINVNDPDNVGKVSKIELVHKNGTIVADNVDAREFTNILSNSDYTIRVTYSYDLNDGLGEQIVVREATAHTKTKTAPTVSIKNIATTKDSVSFEITETPGDVVGTIVKIELVNKNGTIVADHVDVREFTGLFSGNSYTIRVTYSYDLNDGKGVQNVTKEAKTSTKYNEAPVVSILNVVATTDSISFEVEQSYTDVPAKIVRFELVSHGQIVQTITDSYEFTGLFSDHDYTISVIFEYDLNNGYGVTETLVEYDISTVKKPFPNTWINVDHCTLNVVGYDAYYLDSEDVLSVYVELIDSTGNIIAKQDVVSDYMEIEGLSLLSNASYILRFTFTYDLNDGKGIQTFTYDHDVTTVKLDKPVLSLTNEEVTSNSIKAELNIKESYSLNYYPEYKTFLECIFEIYKGSELVAASTNVDFSNLIPNTDYTIKCIYSYDLKDGNGVKTESVDFTYTTCPYIDVVECKIANTSAVSEGETIYMQLSLDNPTNATVESVVVNGQTYNITNASTSKKLFVEIVYNGQFAGGDTYLKIDYIKVKNNGILYSISPDKEMGDNVYIIKNIDGDVEIIDTQFVNENLEPISWAFPSQKVYVLITISNPYGYNIDSINSYTSYQKHGDNQYYFEADWLSKGENYFPICTVSYSTEYATSKVETDEYVASCFVVYSDKVHYISTVEDFKPNSGMYYELTNDIDLSGIEWSGVGLWGVVNGNGYSVKNMSFIGTVEETNKYLGLFSSGYGVIENLNIKEATIIADGVSAAGFFIGKAEKFTHINNCTVDEYSILSVSGKAGGFIGYIYHPDGKYINNYYPISLTNCTNNGNVSGNYAGGFVGYSYDYSCIVFNNNTNNGNVSGDYAGGFIGSSNFYSPAIFSNCTNSGSVTSKNYTGGFIGYAQNNCSTTLINCINNGNISGYQTGGFIGYSKGTTYLTDCANSGTMSGKDFAGGFIGYNYATAYLTNCSNTGNINSASAGEFIGYTQFAITFSNCVNSGIANGTSRTGGFIGYTYCNYIEITNSYSLYIGSWHNGTLCTMEQLNSKSFYTDTLGWSEDVWDLSELDIKNGKYPKLKQN